VMKRLKKFNFVKKRLETRDFKRETFGRFTRRFLSLSLSYILCYEKMTTQTTQTMISSSDLEQKATQQDDLYVSLKKQIWSERYQTFKSSFACKMMLFFSIASLLLLSGKESVASVKTRKGLAGGVILTVHESGNRRRANAMDDGTDVPTLFGGKPERDHDCVSD